MSVLANYTSAIAARIAAYAAGPGDSLPGVPVIVEDSQDLETQINEAVSKMGMAIVIGMPQMDNTGQSIAVADMKITSIIDVGENPVINRNGPPNTKPVCLDVVQGVVDALQGLFVTGFATKLRVMRVNQIPVKDRQLYRIILESRVIIGPTS